MFGGIIEEQGRIAGMRRKEKGITRISIDAGKLGPRLRSGDSIAVDGVCLTVAGKSGKKISVDVSAETLLKTNLSKRAVGDALNLELPLTLSSFLSGHLVQGHVEGIGRVAGWVRDRDDVRLMVQLPASILQYCVPKGSIAINGVSLTIASLERRKIGIALIPYTLEHTNLGLLKPGDTVNVETDVIGRYVVTTIKKNYDHL